MSGAIANSNDDPEMPDRALGVKRPRADPSVSVHYHLEVKFLFHLCYSFCQLLYFNVIIHIAE